MTTSGRRLRLSLVALCTAVAAGCGAQRYSAPARSSGQLERVKTSGHLKAGYIKYPPFVIQDTATGKLSGYFIDLMSAIATEGNFTVDYEETNWGTMVAGLQTGKFDIVVSGVF